MANGKINVAVENIFPLIKKFLYSDHEIFLRELISNATDAISKLKHLSSVGEVKGEIGSPRIEVKVDKDKKKIHMILEMINASKGEKVAICETLLINVDLTIRRSVEYPDWVQHKIQEYKKSCEGFALPDQVGKIITLKK